jgi:hypothetical protein
MCTHLIAINPIILKSVIAYARYALKSEGKNSEIICPPFKSKIIFLMPIIEI